MIGIVCACVKNSFCGEVKEEDNNGEEDQFADVDELEAFSEPEEDEYITR